MIGIIVNHIKLLFSVEVVFLFVSVGLFILIRDVPLLKKKNLKRESIVLRILGYMYIFGSIIFFIVAKNM